MSNKLESIADAKEEEKEKEDKENSEETIKSDDEIPNNDIEEEPSFSLNITKKPDIEIKPLSMTEVLSIKRNNPFLKSGNSPTAKGIIIMFFYFN